MLTLPSYSSGTTSPRSWDGSACAWSSDGSYFAWSCSHRLVNILSSKKFLTSRLVILECVSGLLQLLLVLWLCVRNVLLLGRKHSGRVGLVFKVKGIFFLTFWSVFFQCQFIVSGCKYHSLKKDMHFVLAPNIVQQE